jgi:hypothetical protein
VAGVVANGSQNGNPTQVYTDGPGTTDAAGWQGGFGEGLRIFRNLNIPISGAGVAGGIANGSQNGSPSQTDLQHNNGFSLGLADNTNVPANGAGVALVAGNGSQNGNPSQLDVNPGGDSGFAANLLGNNLNLPINGSGVAGGTGNGAQNGSPAANYLGTGSGLGLAGIGTTPVNANGVMIGTGNGAQNDSPNLLLTPADSDGSPFGPLHLVQNWDLPLMADGITLIPTLGSLTTQADPVSGLEAGVSSLPQQALDQAQNLVAILPVGGGTTGGLPVDGVSDLTHVTDVTAIGGITKALPLGGLS